MNNSEHRMYDVHKTFILVFLFFFFYSFHPFTLTFILSTLVAFIYQTCEMIVKNKRKKFIHVSFPKSIFLLSSTSVVADCDGANGISFSLPSLNRRSKRLTVDSNFYARIKHNKSRVTGQLTVCLFEYYRCFFFKFVSKWLV